MAPLALTLTRNLGLPLPQLPDACQSQALPIRPLRNVACATLPATTGQGATYWERTHVYWACCVDHYKGRLLTALPPSLPPGMFLSNPLSTTGMIILKHQPHDDILSVSL